jgi:exopolysaccharide production protein ExoQ
MPPNIAAIVFTLGVLGLFALNRDRTVRTSKALWIPVIWLLINGSRPVSAWLQLQTLQNMQNPGQYLEGSPFDAFVYSVLIMAGLVPLVRRGAQVRKLLRSNAAVLMFFSYCALSVLWSDYPEASLKRWIKATGDLVMVLIVLTDSDPLAALRRLVVRVGFVLVPASVLLIKYFPALGRVYNIWTWTPMFVGVTDHKNTLGMVCMVLGLGLGWCFLLAYRDHEDKHRARHLFAYGSVLAMIVWLFVQANSLTSQSCFLLATFFLFLTNTRLFTRNPRLAYLLVLAIVAIPVATLFLGIGGGALEEMGRDSTLTGRTDIWRQVLAMSGNPLIGTGFESFWLGDRAERMWRAYYFHPTQAHNGYIETYLELGWTGLVLLAAIIVTGCQNAVAALRWNLGAASIRLACIVVGLIYNLTEAGFRMMTLTWFFFLISAIIVPIPAIQEVPSQLFNDNSRKFGEVPAQNDSVSVFSRKRP